MSFSILIKIIIDRISRYAFEHYFIRPEQFGFRKIIKNISVSTFLLDREISQRRKFKG